MAKRILILCTILFCVVSARSQEISLTVQTGHSATINKLSFSPDGRLMASAGSDNSIVLWDVNTGKQLITLVAHTRKVNDVMFDPSKTQITSCSDDGRVITWNYEDGSKASTFEFDNPVKALCFSPDGTKLAVAEKNITLIDLAAGSRQTIGSTARNTYAAIAFSPDGKLLAFGGAEESNVRVVRVSDNILIDSYHLKTAQLVFSADNRYLLGAGLKGKLRKWDVKNGGMFSTFSATADRVWQSFNAAAMNDKYFFGGNRNNLIPVFSLSSGRKVTVLNGHSQDVNALVLSKDNKILVSAGEDKKIIFWDTDTWEIVKTLQGSSDKINDIEFTDNGNSLVLAYGNGSFRYWQITPGGSMIHNQVRGSKLKTFLRWEYTITDIVSVAGTDVEMQGYRVKSKKRDNDRYKAKGFKVKWDIANNTYSTRKFKKRRNTSYDELLNKQNLVAVSSDKQVEFDEKGQLLLKDKSSDKVLFTSSHGHTDKVTSVKISEQKKLIATAGFDGLIRLRDLSTGEMLSMLLASGENDYIFITPDNYYFSTKGALSNIGFRVKSQVYSFEQFDLKYNRPDLVLDAMNYTDTTVTFAFRKAYEKRVKKANIAVNSITEFDDIPSVEISKRHSSPVSVAKKYSFALSAKPSRTRLDRLYVLVNGVPVYPRGLAVSENGFEQMIDVELSYGVNKVMYYVTNKNGVSSLKHSFQVSYKSDKQQPTLYLVTIGASQYAQSKYNLKYAAKDASDIKALFEKSGKFRDVKKVTLLDRDVTKENIQALATFLAQASVDDVVLITYAGHGLLDKNMDYYLSTYNIDFDNPEENGLVFSEVETLLEGIHSRNKILMIDACHSGEIDKEELELTAKANTTTEAGNISFRAVGPDVKNKNGAGLKTSLELSKTLFADMKSSHGAVIISSAGGGEYAIEGKEWNNGIFTYCFINGLRSKKSDLNRDGKISVTELQRFLGAEVPKLTNGKQTPTSREENINNNFIIW